MRRFDRLPSMQTRCAPQRGSILVSVLWVIIILTVVVLGLVYEARSDIQRGILYRDRAKAYWLARAGVERAKYDYALAKSRQDEEFEKQSRFHYDFGYGFADCLLESEISKMPVNSQNREMWEQIFTYYGKSEDEVAEIVDAIWDWRDADDMPQLNGAESEVYQAMSPPYRPRNGPFLCVEELLLVRGISEDLYYGSQKQGQYQPGLKDILSMDEPSVARFDINTCPKGILMVFLEISEEDAKMIMELREEKAFENVQEAGSLIALEAADNLERFFTAYRGNQFRIRSTGSLLDSPARYTVEDRVRYIGGPQLFYTRAHVDFSMDHVDGSTVVEEEEKP